MKNYSDMREIKNVLIVAVLLLAAVGFYTYQVNPKVGQHREIKSESPCEKEYKKFSMNGGECFYKVDEDIVARNCTWLYAGKRCEKHMWRT